VHDGIYVAEDFFGGVVVDVAGVEKSSNFLRNILAG